MGLLLPIVAAGFAFASAFLEFKKNGGRDRAKVALSAGVFLCSVLVVWNNRKTSADAELKAQEARDALGKQTEQTLAARAAASAARVDAARAAETSTKTGELCLSSWRAGEGISEFLNKLPPAKAASLVEGDCGAPPPWRFGAAQIRFITGKSRQEADMRRDRFMRQVLGHIGGENWSPHILTPVETVPSDRNNRNHYVYVVAINEIEAELKDPVCFWLKCMGVDPGAETCDLRPEQSIQGAIGRWGAHPPREARLMEAPQK